MKKVLLLFMAAALMGMPVEAKKKDKKKKGKAKTEAPAPAPKKKEAKPSISRKGMLNVEKVGTEWFLEVPDSLLGKDILAVTRYTSTPSSAGQFGGEECNEQVVFFQMNPDSTLLLRSRMTINLADSTEAISKAINVSNEHPIIGAFKLEKHKDGKSRIKVTQFLNSDNPLGMMSYIKKSFTLGMQDAALSYVEDIKTFPTNTEFRLVMTYNSTGRSLPASAYTGKVTFGLNISMVLLPEEPMMPRLFDQRVGYFTHGFNKFSDEQQRVGEQIMISRFRLEPKNAEDAEKMRRGELIEPKKPIIYYIDPATPKEWVPYLIAGVNDWQPAFEKAGFKNAIMAKVAPTPEEDPTWSLEDARYSAIVYKPSDIPNASGPHVNDPRSGEIIESHINWYHNVMLLLRNWYFIQCSPVDPAARKMTFDTELMGQLVRFVSSHEVGHTLGLRHNFAGTSFFTADQLRDTTFLRKHGHTTSIMDYSRFNYVAQPGDNIPQELLFPRINSYDEWAIEWGYRRFPEIDDPEAELPKINEWIIEKTKDPLYRFGTESNPSDPRLQSEDLGCNQMETNELGVKNLKYIMAHLLEWTSEPNKGYDNLKTLHGEVITQYKRYMNHVARYIGGVYGETKTVEQPGANYTHVEKAKQKEALAFLKRNLFEPQLWLVPNEVMDKIVTRPDITIESLYTAVLKNIMSRRVMLNLSEAEVMLGKDAYTMADLYKDMNDIVFAPLSSDVKKAAYQRMLQKSYIETIISIYKKENPMARGGASLKNDNSDIISMAYYQLKHIQTMCSAKASGGSTAARAHYSYLVEHIKNVIENPDTKK